MKLIIDIPDEIYECYKGRPPRLGDEGMDSIAQSIANGIPYEARPTGEWITIGEEQGALGIIYKIRKCSKCGWEHSLVIPNNFCPNCGADMRGDTQ